MIAGSGRWPRMRWSYRERGDGVDLTLSSDLPPKEARLFHVQAPTRDFRDSRWTFEPMSRAGRGFTGHWPAPKEGFAAVFGEAVYEIDGRVFTLSTQIRILGGEK
jgi:hypothetical protein